MNQKHFLQIGSVLKLAVANRTCDATIRRIAPGISRVFVETDQPSPAQLVGEIFETRFLWLATDSIQPVYNGIGILKGYNIAFPN